MLDGQGEPEVLAHKNRVLDEWCAKVGRDPGAIERTVRIDPPEFDRIDDYIGIGVTHFICGGNAPFEFDDLKRLIALRDERR